MPHVVLFVSLNAKGFKNIKTNSYIAHSVYKFIYKGTYERNNVS
jgi:hypothetical protein